MEHSAFKEHSLILLTPATPEDSSQHLDGYPATRQRRSSSSSKIVREDLVNWEQNRSSHPREQQIGLDVHTMPAPTQGWAAYAVDMIMGNHFDRAVLVCELKKAAVPELRVTETVLAVLKAVSTFGNTDFIDALTCANNAITVGERLEKEPDRRSQLGGALIQADCYLLTAMVHFIQQSRLKAMWAVRSSWILYNKANKNLSVGGDAAAAADADWEDLKGWSSYGVGFFNLVLSLLPATVLKIAEILGYTGDREYGLKCLISTMKLGSKTAQAPLACLQLLWYYVTISVFTGDSKPQDHGTIEELLKWAKINYPGGIFFAFMESRYCRIRKNLLGAIKVAEKAVIECSQLPSAAVLFYFQNGWCAFILLEWQASALYFERLMNHHRLSSPNFEQLRVGTKLVEDVDTNEEGVMVAPVQTPTMLLYIYMIGVAWGILKRWEACIESLQRRPRILAMGKNARPMDIWAAEKCEELLSVVQSDSLSQKEIWSVCVLNALELLHRWNTYDHMSPLTLVRTYRLFLRGVPQLASWVEGAATVDFGSENEEEKVKAKTPKPDSFTLRESDRARAILMFGCLVNAAGKLEFADTVLSNVIKATFNHKCKKIKKDGTLAWAHFELASLYLKMGRLDEAQENHAIAKKFSGYDLYNICQLRLHGLDAQIRKASGR